jgi:hypothetical protein
MSRITEKDWHKVAETVTHCIVKDLSKLDVTMLLGMSWNAIIKGMHRQGITLTHCKKWAVQMSDGRLALRSDFGSEAVVKYRIHTGEIKQNKWGLVIMSESKYARYKRKDIGATEAEYSAKQTAEILKYSASRLSVLVDAGHIKRTRIGKYDKSSVDAYAIELEERRQIQPAKWLNPGSYAT